VDVAAAVEDSAVEDSTVVASVDVVSVDVASSVEDADAASVDVASSVEESAVVASAVVASVDVASSVEDSAVEDSTDVVVEISICVLTAISLPANDLVPEYVLIKAQSPLPSRYNATLQMLTPSHLSTQS
jgi:hypothetical protein